MDHVEGRVGQRIDADVVTTELYVGGQRARHPVGVDVSCDYVTPNADPPAHE
jgi:hypothetical protein